MEEWNGRRSKESNTKDAMAADTATAISHLWNVSKISTTEDECNGKMLVGIFPEGGGNRQPVA